MKSLSFSLVLLATLSLVTGCQPPVTVVTPAQEVNLVSNGDFSQGAQDWMLYGQNGGALSLSVAAGRADVTVLAKGTGTEPYFDAQLKHSFPGIPLVAGKTYTLTYEAWADAQRFLAVTVWENGRDTSGNGSAWDSYCFSYADLTTTPQQFSRTFTMTVNNPTAGLGFGCGASTVSIHLAKVKLVQN